MTILTWAALLASCLALAFSIGAVVAMRRSSHGRLSAQLRELSDAQDSLNIQLRSVKVRISALSKPRKGGKFATDDDADADPDMPERVGNPLEWKRRMNLRLALGKGKP